jgi:cardiolipin synthase
MSRWRNSAIRRLAIILVSALLAGYAALHALAAAPPPSAPLLGPAPAVTLGADQVALLRSGPATFARIARLIVGARSTIDVEVYEFNRPDLAQALIDAHVRGVVVTVIHDPSESSSAATASRLRAHAIDVIDYPIRSQMIDHVKLLVVDAHVAVVGGINWGINSPANHDYDAEVRGPAVANLERIFSRDLVTCGRRRSIPGPIEDPSITVAATLPGAEIRPLAVDVIDRAVHRLDLELFVLTDTGVVHALEAAVARGVQVHVLLDPSQPSSKPAFAALAAGSVDVRWYRGHGELLHAKAIVADAMAVLFGSANWSGGGFARNHELDIDMPWASAVASEMVEQMTLDWAASA